MKYILWTLPLLVTACAKPIEPRNGFKPATCPSAVYLPSHEVTVTSATIPEKLAVYVDGVLKVDECANLPKGPPAPVVEITRERAALKIRVIHVDAYPTLPEEMALEIQDLGTCNSANVFLKEDHIPLTFTTEYPHGKKCGSKTSAKVELSN